MEVLDSTTLDDIDLAPAQEDHPASGFNLTAFDAALYSRDRFYPETNVELAEPALWRGLRVVNLRTDPIRYNPVTRQLRVARNYRVTLSFQGVDLVKHQLLVGHRNPRHPLPGRATNPLRRPFPVLPAALGQPEA